MQIFKARDSDKNQLEKFLKKNWGDCEMVISSGRYNYKNLQAYIYKDVGCVVGLITFIQRATNLEIISVDSTIKSKGIGTALINHLEKTSRDLSVKKISVITTNDNLEALRFYQKNGYRIVEVFPNAVKEARKIKPSIPLFAANGIPILDELRLEKIF